MYYGWSWWLCDKRFRYRTHVRTINPFQPPTKRPSHIKVCSVRCVNGNAEYIITPSIYIRIGCREAKIEIFIV